MESSIKLQVAELKHSEPITQSQIEMAKETENKDLNREVVTRAVKKLIENPVYGFYLVSLDKEAVAASLMITYEYNYIKDITIFWFQSVYVYKDYRMKGLFKNMYQYIYNKAKAEKAHSLRLYVDLDNKDAMSVYSKMGMSDTGESLFEVDLAFDPTKKIEFEKGYTGLSDASEYRIRKFTLEDLKNLNLEEFTSILDEDKDVSKAQAGVLLSLKGDRSSEVWLLVNKEKVVGVLSVFYEFSDWRDSVMFWVNDLRIRNGTEKEQQEHTALIFKLYYDMILAQNALVLRFILGKPQTWVKSLLTNCGVPESHYRIYEQIIS